MPTLGMGELLIVLMIVLLIFGASRLPQIGEGLGKAVRGLKRGLQTDDDIDVTPKDKQVGDSSSALGNDHEVHDHQDGEDDDTNQIIAADNETAEGRAQNRRVEISIDGTETR